MTTTPTVRERFEKECDHIYEIYQLADTEIEKIYSFLEKEISEAEARGRQEMKEKCLKCIPDYEWSECFISEANEMGEGVTNEIRNSIQSL